MKRTPLLLVALMPFVASAGAAPESTQNVDVQELSDDLQATALLGMNVESGGQEIGAIEDIVFDKDGSIASVIVQREGGVEQLTGEAEQAADDARVAAEDAWDDATDDRDRPTRDTVADSSERGEDDADGMGLDPDRMGTAEMGDAFAKVDWSSLSVDSQNSVVRVAGGGASLQNVAYDQTEPLGSTGEVRASHLIGMEVNLSDEESFGEVEDVMIDPATGKASAIVVDSMEFFDKERFALPVDLANVDTQEETLTVQYTKQQMEQMEEYEMPDDSGVMDNLMDDDGDTGVDEEM